MATGLGTRIKRARERKRLTQQQLADALGRSVRAVNDWENDRTSPRSDIGALEEVLGVRFDEAETEQPRKIDRHQRRVIRAALPDDEDYERVIGVLEGRLIVIEPGEGSDEPGRSAL